jgi:hypothetical protein
VFDLLMRRTWAAGHDAFRGDGSRSEARVQRRQSPTTFRQRQGLQSGVAQPAASACARSTIRSSGCAMPIDRRIVRICLRAAGEQTS